jgi:hypothetical protein
MMEQNVEIYGRSSEFIEDIRRKIETIALDKSQYIYIEQGWEGFRRANKHLKEIEQELNFFDYQACVVLPLSNLARLGSSHAMQVVQEIITNTSFYLRSVQNRQLIRGLKRLSRLSIQRHYRTPLRRIGTYLVLSYKNLEGVLTKSEKEMWNKLMHKIAEQIVAHSNSLKPNIKEPHSSNLGIGTNHYSLMSEALWLLGKHFKNEKWYELAADFSDRLMSFAPIDGYFEEHTNIAREGGPSLRYTPLSSGAMYHIQLWKGTLKEERFFKCDEFQRNMVDQNLNVLCFADERSNDTKLRPFGIALHSLTPEGRYYLHRVLTNGKPLDPDCLDLQGLARVYFETESMQTGSCTCSAPFENGFYRISLPLGIMRQNGWTAGLSTLKCLNRELYPNGPYALDMQNLLFLSHKRAGIILRGFKSKNNILWSTVRKGMDGYTVETGELRVDKDKLCGLSIYKNFSVQLSWYFDESITLQLLSNESKLTLQLPLEITWDTIVLINDSHELKIHDQNIKVEGISSISTNQWKLESSIAGDLLWPVGPFSPYNANNLADRHEQRALFSIDWSRTITVKFTPLV